MVIQTTFPETMRVGIPGMINRQVQFNTVTRSSEAVAIPPCRAVSQSTTSDIGCVLGGTLIGFLGISELDPTIVTPTTLALNDGVIPPYTNLTILTSGEMFATAAVAITAGDPVNFIAVDGVMSNTGGIGPIPGARWKYTRPPGELNVVQLGIQR